MCRLFLSAAADYMLAHSDSFFYRLPCSTSRASSISSYFYRMKPITCTGYFQALYMPTANYSINKTGPLSIWVHVEAGTLYATAAQNGFNPFTHSVPLRTNPRMQLKASHWPRLH